MTCERSFVLVLALVLGAGRATADPPAATPFGVPAAQAAKLELSLKVQGGKTGAGYDEIVIVGSGEVRLVRTANYAAKPELRTGRVAPEVASALFALAHEAGVLDRPDAIENDRSQSHWNTTVLSIKLPGRTKVIAVDGGRLKDPEPPDWFYKLVGAARLAARVAFPKDAVPGGFLRWL